MTINGTAGNDNLNGTSGNDTFELWQGGNDTASGQAGDDIFNFVAAFTAQDHIDGGTGNDTVELSGDYSAGVTFASNTMLNVETIQLGPGFNYNLTTVDATVSQNTILTLNGIGLGPSNFVTFNGAAETNGAFHLTGGAGNDNLTAGAKNDIIDDSAGGNDTVHAGAGNDLIQMGGALDTQDTIDGGAGGDIIRLNGDYSELTGLGSLTGVEQIQVAPGNDYDLYVFRADSVLTVNGQTLGVNDQLSVDGTQATAGIDVIGGAGNDIVLGSTSADIIDITHGGEDYVDLTNNEQHTPDVDIVSCNGAFDANDQIEGNGLTIIRLLGNYNTVGVTMTEQTIFGIAMIQMGAGHSYKLTTADDNVGNGNSLAINGGALLSTDVLTFNGSAEDDGGKFVITGGAGNDLLTGGSAADHFILTDGGNDNVHGGGGNDLVSAGGALTTADIIDGGDGNDTVDVTSNSDTVASSVSFTSVEQMEMDLVNDRDYNFVIGATDVQSGERIFFSGANLTSHTITVNASAIAAGGIVSLSGGAGNDSINFGTHYISTDQVLGGGGNDSVFVTISTNAIIGENKFTSVEQLHDVLADTGGYSLVLAASDVGTGQVLTIDGSGLTSGDTVIFDGSAKTAGTVVAVGGTGSDSFTMAANDFVEGNGGADAITLNGAATLQYLHASDSTGTVYDSITGFNAANTDFAFPAKPTGYDGAHSEAIDEGNLNTSMAAAVIAAGLQAHHAIIITDTTAGDLNGHNFLIVDVNGDAHYTAGTDYLIDLGTNSVTGFAAANFV